MGALDSSFASFQNSTETVGDEDLNFEIVFNNKALLKILGVNNSKDLHSLQTKPLFVHREHAIGLSLL